MAKEKLAPGLGTGESFSLTANPQGSSTFALQGSVRRQGSNLPAKTVAAATGRRREKTRILKLDAGGSAVESEKGTT